MKRLDNGYGKPSCKSRERSAPRDPLSNRQGIKARHKSVRFPSNVGAPAGGATGEAGTRTAPLYLFIGGPKEFLIQEVRVGLLRRGGVCDE